MSALSTDARPGAPGGGGDSSLSAPAASISAVRSPAAEARVPVPPRATCAGGASASPAALSGRGTPLHDRIRELRAAGLSRAQIMGALGVGKSVVYEVVPVRAQPAPPPVEPAAPVERRAPITHPERALAAAVLERAVQDATTPVLQGEKRWLGDRAQPTGAEARHARLFLTATRGPWAESREIIADMAGIDPDALRQHALRLGVRP